MRPTPPLKCKNCKNYTKTVFLTILNWIWEVWGCPGAWHGPCEPIPSNFGGIWRTDSLQIGPRIFWEARAPNKTDEFSEKWPRTKILFRCHLSEINRFYLVPWLPKKSEDQSGGQRNNLEVDEVSFQYFQKTWTSTSLMPCKTKPCQSSRGSHCMVHAMPPDTPRPPKYNLELSKNKFLWKTWFPSVSAVF